MTNVNVEMTMRALLVAAGLLTGATAFAESENPPVAEAPATASASATPAATAAPSPVPVPLPSSSASSAEPAPAEATPAPSATPAGARVIPAPAWAAAVSTPAPEPRVARDPLGWEVETAVHSQGVFDGGMRVFSEGSYLRGAELRVRKTMPGAMSRFSFAPEISYGAAHAVRLYPGSATTELWLQRFQAGARGSMAIDRLPALRPVARAGATGLWGTALAHDSFRHHREEAYGFGAYLSGGLEADLGQAFTVLDPQQHLTFGLEVGHLYTGGLQFGDMGRLDVNGVFYSAQLGLRF